MSDTANSTFDKLDIKVQIDIHVTEDEDGGYKREVTATIDGNEIYYERKWIPLDANGAFVDAINTIDSTLRDHRLADSFGTTRKVLSQVQRL